jgi:hypothetical protein
MRRLSIIFAVVALVGALWVCGGTTLLNNGIQQVTNSVPPALDDPNHQGASDLSKGILSGLGAGFFACTGIPVILVAGGLALFFLFRKPPVSS